MWGTCQMSREVNKWPIRWMQPMERARIDISEDLDGQPVVHAVFDLTPDEIGAAAHAVRATVAERFRMEAISADDVVELRELTTLADELGELSSGASTVVLRPARLSSLRQAVTQFVETREDSDWIRDEDRQPLAIVRELLWPLEQLSEDATRAALSPGSQSSAPHDR
jgi:hypothetical protein